MRCEICFNFREMRILFSLKPLKNLGIQIYLNLSIKLRDIQRAESLAEELIREWPDTAEHWKTAGAVRLRRGDSTAAIDAFQKSIELDPDEQLTTCLLLALAYQAQADEEQAAIWHRKSEQLLASEGDSDTVDEALRDEYLKNLKSTTTDEAVEPAEQQPVLN